MNKRTKLQDLLKKNNLSSASVLKELSRGRIVSFGKWYKRLHGTRSMTYKEMQTIQLVIGILAARQEILLKGFEDLDSVQNEFYKIERLRLL